MPGERRRILLIDDEPHLRAHVRETIDDLQADLIVEEAEDGQQAVEMIAAAADPYGLIVSDIHMPRMDGLTLLRELSNMRICSPVVMLTAFGQDDYVINCLRDGAVDYLVKPVDIDALQSAVTSALQHGAAGLPPVNVDYDPAGWFEVSGGSDYSVLYRFRRFMELLDRFRLPDEIADQVRLTLEELGRNAIEWGNHHDRDKSVTLSCRIFPTKMIMQISDQGEGFIPTAVPDPSIDPANHITQRMASGKRMGGYGLHLVRNIMDKLVYNSTGNTVVAIKYLEPHGKPSVDTRAAAE
jgi:CheY-like chemotaxis protein/anti-sigma regulatory factor (Ser/Thr protein kinase)